MIPPRPALPFGAVLVFSRGEVWSCVRCCGCQRTVRARAFHRIARCTVCRSNVAIVVTRARA